MTLAMSLWTHQEAQPLDTLLLTSVILGSRYEGLLVGPANSMACGVDELLSVKVRE